MKQVAGARWKDSDLIFPSNVGTPIGLCNLRKEFVRVLRIAGLPEIRFHDLRHTAASIMLKRNIPIFTVSRVLGHSRPSITLDIYAHMIPGMQDMVAKIMDDAITPIPVGVESEDVEDILAEMDDDDDLQIGIDSWLE
jgi:integrase